MKRYFLLNILFVFSLFSECLIGQVSEDTTLARKYFIKAGSFTQAAQHDSAVIYFEKASVIYEKHKIWDRYVQCYNMTGHNFRKEGKYEKAMRYLKKAIKIGLAHLGENHLVVARSYNAMGAVYWGIDDYQQATVYLRKALEIRLRFLGENHPDVASSYNNIGVLYWETGDYDQALEYYHKSLSIKQQLLGEDHLEVALSYNNIGAVYWEKNELDPAIAYFKKSLVIYENILGEMSPDVADSYNNIGAVYRERGDDDQAMKYLNKALKINIQILGKKHPEVSRNYYNLGELYSLRGDFDQAIHYFKKALSIRIENVGEKHSEVAGIYQGMAHMYFQKRDYNKALAHYQASIRSLVYDFNDENIYQNPPLKNIILAPMLLNSLAAKADVFEKYYTFQSHAIKDLKYAVSTYELASELIDKIRMGYKAEGSKLFLGEKAHEIYEEAIQTAHKLYEMTRNEKDKEKVLIFAEKSRTGVLRQALIESQAKRFSGIPDNLLEKEKQLRIDLSYYDTHLQKEYQKKMDRDSLKIREFKNTFFSLNTQYLQLLEELETQYPRYYQLKYQTRIAAVANIQDVLDDQTLMLEYFVGDTTLFIFTLTKTNFDLTAVPMNPHFSDWVRQYLRSMKKVEPKGFLQNSWQLYQVLIQPVEDRFLSKTKLVIIPDGILSYIPFESLVTEKPRSQRGIDFTRLSYLIRKFEISYSYAATLLSKPPQDMPESEAAFIGFAPVFSDSVKNGQIHSTHHAAFDTTQSELTARSVTIDGIHLNELKHTEGEIKSIIALFGSQKKKGVGYLYQEASEENFKTHVKDYRYVHIATHGLINKDSPQLSGLIFSQPSQIEFEEDGVLYASETYNLKINADLVVLSSCESGIGKLVKGEGLLTLGRGFLYSGAKNIIFSLWEVYDELTSQLMVEFYQNVLVGKSYAQSLREAKLKLIKNPDSAFPAKWSAFVLVGR